MKKIVLILCALTSFSSFAQDEMTETFIVKAGANIGFISGGAPWKSTVGYQMGLAMNIPLTENLSFVPEINYNKINAKLAENTVFPGETVSSFTTTVSSFTIPLMIRYNITDKIGIFAGPHASFIAWVEKEKYVNGNLLWNKDKVTAYVKDIDYGAMAGLSFNVTERISIEAKYTLGLNEMDTKPNQFNTQTNEMLGKISSVSLSLGYKL